MIGKMLKSAALAAALTVAATGATPAVDLKWAHVYEDGAAYHKWALWASEEIAARTEGRVNITVYPASSLGNESDINEGLTIGSVDMIYTGPNFAERDYGPIAISDYPFMLKDYDHWKAYRDSDLFQELSEGYKEATGHTVMAITWYGYRHVTSKFPIQIGDTFRVRQDCSKLWDDAEHGCLYHWGADRYKYFGGFPDIPVADGDSVQTPGGRISGRR